MTQKLQGWWSWSAILSVVLGGATGLLGAELPAVESLQTSDGIRFGLMGKKPAAPAPTVLVFAGDHTNSLQSADFNKAGQIAGEKGFLLASVDLPCHGKEVKPGEAAGINGWASRLKNGEDPVADLVKRAGAVLDFLIKEGYTDVNNVGAIGTSRGGFMVLHLAAVEPRVKWVIAFAPVTDLRAVTEFKGMQDHAGTKAIDLRNNADKLAGRAIWMCIGNHDERVNTDHAIEFTRKVVAASVAAKKHANIEMHIMPSLGHSIHKTAHQEAAAWLLAQQEKK